MRRLPVEPVERLVLTMYGPPARGEGFSAVWERATGLHRNTWFRNKAQGGFTHTMADKVALALGYHPAQIWDEWHDE